MVLRKRPRRDCINVILIPYVFLEEQQPFKEVLSSACIDTVRARTLEGAPVFAAYLPSQTNISLNIWSIFDSKTRTESA